LIACAIILKVVGGIKEKILKDMLYQFFTLPTSTLSDLQGYIGDLVTDTSLLWILAIALPLGFWIIYKVISVVKRGAR
jgi:hypothetical protein